jgi:serine/threonine-protein kinase
MTEGLTATEKLREQLQAATLGDYEILAELGRGGMATVFLAHDLQLDRKVAIKVMHPALMEEGVKEGMVDRFKQEARTAAGLSHPNIIPIYAVRAQGHLLWIVMKFVPGRPLDSIIAEAAPLPVPMVRAILAGVAEALDYAHRHGVVHRDVKPANIMIDLEGRPVVTDFGVAKVADQQHLTMTGTAVGTPNYMSPEQAHAEPTTGASDQYSLAVVAFEMLTGKPLYTGDSAVGVMFLHAYGDVPERPAFGPETPEDLADALIRMLNKDPSARWPALHDALPLLRGDTPLHESRIRSDMAALAATGMQGQILARVSTPRSPTPKTMRAPVAPVMTPGPATSPAPARARSPLWIAVAGVLTAAITLMLWRPWAAPPDRASLADSIGPPRALPDQPPPPPPPAPEPVAVAPPASPTATSAVRDLRIAGSPGSLSEGDSISLQARVLDQDGRAIQRPVSWASSDPRTAVVRASGMLVALAPGRVTVIASADGRQARAELEVVSMIASIIITPASETLLPTRSVSLLASARRRDGSEVAGTAMAWRSSDEAVAVVSSTGRVTALAPGTAAVSATAGGRRGTATITVASPSAAVAVAPPPPPPPPPPAAQPPADDVASAVNELVAAYARALQSKDMARVRALFPGISAAAERQTRSALEDMNDLQVRLSASGITGDGSRAQARVGGVWTYRGGRPLEVNNLYRFEKRASGWVIVAIE